MKTLWIGPRANAFMTEIATILARGDEHCVLFLPERLHSSFLSAFRKVVENSSNFMHSITLDKGQTLLSALQPLFCDDQIPQAIEQVTVCNTRQCAIPVLVAPGRKTPAYSQCLRLASILQGNAKIARNGGYPLSWRMLFITTPGAPFPDEDTGLRHFHWWGQLKPSDLEFAIEDAFAPYNLRQPVWLWYYALCRGLCQTALELIPEIIGNSLSSMAEIRALLLRHPFCTKKHAEMVRALLDKGPIALHRLQHPSGDFLPAWREGIIEIGCNGQPEIHPAALLASGRIQLLKSRVLAGQIQVYFPLVQEAYRLITANLRSFRCKKEIGEEILDSGEIGALQNFFTTHPQIANAMPQARELATLWWKVRNSLAHHNLLDVKLAIRAVLVMERMRATMQEYD